MDNPKLYQIKPKAILPVQAIIFADVSDPPEQASLPEVRQRLRDEADRVQPKENERTLVYGNTHGHERFDMLSVLRKEVEESRKEREESNKKREKFEKMIEESGKELEKFRKEREGSRKETAEYRTIVDHHENQIEDLTAKVRDLTETSQGYLDIRARFLNVYQRRHGNLDEQQRKEIKKGNLGAHSGDAAVDAKLYRDTKRSDSEIFQELYGLQYEQVLNLADDETVDGRVFHVLDIHGTHMARGNRFPTKLENAFTSYISEVCKESEERASHKSPYQAHPYESINDVATRARTFWNLYRQFQNSTKGMES